MSRQRQLDSIHFALGDTPVDSPILLLLRHADRGPIPEGDPGNDIPLLPRGVQRALALGEHIGDQLVSVHTSPVKRCVQTAEAIVQGTGLPMAVLLDKHLGDPGVYVLEDGIAWEAWQTMGHERVVNSIVAGRQLPGLADPIPATQRLVDWMLRMAGGRPGVHIFVTHDLLVTCAAAHCLDQRLTVSDWPIFLEAMTLRAGAGPVSATYRGMSHPLSWTV